MDKKIREDQINFIQKIRPLLRSNLAQSNAQETVHITSHQKSTQEINAAKLNELIQRIEKIEEMLEEDRQIEGVRKRKVKEQIISLLQPNKKLSSTQLSKLIGLSRTRCNEYFRELTREGVTEGIIIDRKKYYKFVRK